MALVPVAEPIDKEAEPQRSFDEGHQLEAGHIPERGGPDDATTSQPSSVYQMVSEKPEPLHDLLREIDEEQDASKEQLEIISKQLNEAQGNIDLEDWRNTALHIAAARGLSNVVDALIQNGVNVNGAEKGDEFTALHYAVTHRRTAVLRQLLDQGANVLATDNEGHTPLLFAMLLEYEDGVDALIGSKQGSSYLNEPVKGYTLLAFAIVMELYTMVKKLLKANVDGGIRAKTGESCLHYAIWEYSSGIFSEVLEKSGVDVNATDEQGATVLHYLCGAEFDGNNSNVRAKVAENSEAGDKDGSEEELKVLKRLLEKSADPLIKTPNGETALHFAAATNRRKLQQELLNFLARDQSKFQQALLDAATHFTTHTSAKLLLSYNENKTNSKEDLSDDISAIEWAAITKNPQILWWLIATSPRANETEEQIRAAKKQIGLSYSKQSKQKPTTSKGLSNYKGKEKLKHAGVTKLGDANDPEVVIRDILYEPPIAQVYRDDGTLQQPKSEGEMSEIFQNFDSRVIQVYKGSHISNIIRRDRSVQEVIYTSGPAHLMESVKCVLKDMWTDGIRNIKEDAERTQIQAMYDDEKLRFTWIHLPVTNIEWMKDLLQAIMYFEKKYSVQDFNQINSFLRDSWFEIPDRTSPSRIMRPRFIKRTQNEQLGIRPHKDQQRSNGGLASENVQEEGKGDTTNTDQREERNDQDKQETREGNQTGNSKQDDFINASAIYMPFLSTSTRCNGETEVSDRFQNPRDKLEQLKGAYKYPVIHEPATLDESYYHFEDDADSTKDKRIRNQNQIISKEWRRSHTELGTNDTGVINQADTKKPQIWPVLQVNQIWIWTLADRWLISATSPPFDDEERLWVDGFIEHLNKRVDDGGAQSQPGSIDEMMREMISYCIGSYERPPVKESRTENFKLDKSIRQVYSNYINFIGRKESGLFDDVKYQTELPEHSNELARNSIKKAMEVFTEIKDIRDELNILKSFAQYQSIIQNKLSGGRSASQDLTADYIVNDLKEMDALAARIQSAANSTLTLLESEIANKQAEQSVEQGKESVKQGEESVRQGRQSVKQGRIFLVFTVATIFFLPMSFLSALFALDVEAALQSPGWIYVIIFGSTSVCIPLAWYAIYPDEVHAWIQKRYPSKLMPGNNDTSYSDKANGQLPP